jgi:hypothetical protein
MICVFGDSHAGKFNYHPGPYKVWGAKAATAHNLINPESSRQSWAKLMQMLPEVDKEKDVLLLVLGEIDCRIHIYRQHIIKKKPVLDVARRTVKRYLSAVESVQSLGYRVAVLDIPPATRQGNFFNLDHYGTRIQRAGIIRVFNGELRRECMARGIAFVGIYEDVADERGYLKDEYALDDDAHLKPEVVPFVTERLKKLFPDAV